MFFKFEWKNNKWMYLSKDQYLANLTVQEQSGKQVTIPRLELSKAQCTRGVHIAADGNNKAEVECLTQVTKEWGGKKQEQDPIMWQQTTAHNQWCRGH